MGGLLLVLGFPLVLAVGYTLVYTAARLWRGREGIRLMNAVAPLLFPVFLAIPVVAVVNSGLNWPDLLRWPHWQTWATVVAAIPAGALLFFGESALNRRLAAGRGGAGALDGMLFLPSLMPLLSMAVVAGEELVWRGYLIAALQTQWAIPLVCAVVGAAAAFALHHVHFGVVTAVYKGASAIVWSVLFLISGSLVPAFVAHLTSDWLAWRRLARIAGEQAKAAPAAAALPSPKPVFQEPLQVEGEQAIRVIGLSKRYGGRLVVDELSFAVRRGEIFGLLGRNGAGKTTTLECLEGLRTPDAGIIRVLGMPAEELRRQAPERIGVQLQNARFFARLTVYETLKMVASLYPRSLPVEQVMSDLLLTGQRDTAFKDLSGGQQQRVAVAAALLPDPELLFLDEVSTGLDPSLRRRLWRLLAALRERGKTIVMTTHYMEEAERLCDRVALLKDGRLLALDNARRLIDRFTAWRCVEFSVAEPLDMACLRALGDIEHIEAREHCVRVYSRRPDLIKQLVHTLDRGDYTVKEFRTIEPTLEDVFLQLTGAEADGPQREVAA